MLRELESPGVVKIVMYLVVVVAVGVALLVQTGGDGVVLTYLQGQFQS